MTPKRLVHILAPVPVAALPRPAPPKEKLTSRVYSPKLLMAGGVGLAGLAMALKLPGFAFFFAFAGPRPRVLPRFLLAYRLLKLKRRIMPSGHQFRGGTLTG